MSLDQSTLDLQELFAKGLIVPSEDFDIERLPNNRQRVHLRNIPEPQPPPTDVLGCMDPLATNYNPLATIDDGSCEYALATGACCYAPDGFCYDDTQPGCEANGTDWTYLGDGTSCPACNGFKGYVDACARYRVRTLTYDRDDEETGAFFHATITETYDPDTCELTVDASGSCRNEDAEEDVWGSEICNGMLEGHCTGDCIDYAISQTEADCNDVLVKHCTLSEQYWPF